MGKSILFGQLGQGIEFMSNIKRSLELDEKIEKAELEYLELKKMIEEIKIQCVQMKSITRMCNVFCETIVILKD